jgi:predicted helicase
MQTPLRQLLAQYREHSQTEREKGTYFERLAIVFMQRDPGMIQEYENCWDFATWARQQGLPATDNGVDAVAKIRGEDSFCAIQCKFYREGGNIPKGELDKFLSTLGASRHFSRGLIIETAGQGQFCSSYSRSDEASRAASVSVRILGRPRENGRFRTTSAARHHA